MSASFFFNFWPLLLIFIVGHCFFFACAFRFHFRRCVSVFFFCFILCALCVSLFDFAFVRCFAAYTRTLHKFGVNSASISGRLVRRGLSRTMLRENNDTRMCRFLCFVCIGRFWLSGHRLHKLLKSKSFSDPNHCHCILNANVFLVCLVQIGQSHAFIHAFF